MVTDKTLKNMPVMHTVLESLTQHKVREIFLDVSRITMTWLSSIRSRSLCSIVCTLNPQTRYATHSVFRNFSYVLHIRSLSWRQSNSPRETMAEEATVSTLSLPWEEAQ